MAQVDVGEVTKDVVVASSVSALGSTAVADESSRKGAAVKSSELAAKLPRVTSSFTSWPKCSTTDL